MAKGKLIVIEGSDGSGKSTQLEQLANYCQTHNIACAVFDFPQYDKTFFGKMCKDFLFGKYGDNISPYLISLPYAADRWKAKGEIEKALSEGKLVFLNRYAPSNAVYQGARLPEDQRDAFIEWEFQLEYREFGIPKEDVVVYLHVPVEISQKLIADKQKDYNEKDLVLLKTTEALYQRFCNTYDNWFCIECAPKKQILSKEEIHMQIVAELQKKGILS